jgi:hypothetical protein
MSTVIAILVGALGIVNYLAYVKEILPRTLQIIIQIVLLVIAAFAWFTYGGQKLESWSGWMPGWTIRRGIQFLAMLGLLVTMIMMVLKLK